MTQEVDYQLENVLHALDSATLYGSESGRVHAMREACRRLGDVAWVDDALVRDRLLFLVTRTVIRLVQSQQPPQDGGAR